MMIKPRTQVLLLIAAFLVGFAIFGGPAIFGHRTGGLFALIKAPLAEPTDGWTVCEDLYFGPIPGIPEWRQRFRLCHPDGWEYIAYCRELWLPMPPIGTTCSLAGDGIFTCGQYVQTLQFFEVVATPPAPPPPRPTRTPVPSATITRRPRVNTPPPGTPVPPTYITTTPFAGRPHPGGDGNRGWVVTFVLATAALIVVQAGGLLLFLRRK